MHMHVHLVDACRYRSRILREGGLITHPNLCSPLNPALTQFHTPIRTPWQPQAVGPPPPLSPTSPTSSSTLASRCRWNETTPFPNSSSTTTTSRTWSPINLRPHNKGFSPLPTYFETVFRPISNSNSLIRTLLITRTFTSPSYLMLPPLHAHMDPCPPALFPLTPLIHPRIRTR